MATSKKKDDTKNKKETPRAPQPEVSLRLTEKRTLKSKITDQEYQVFVSLPLGYNDSDKDYPVLFCLDADRQFPMAWNVTMNLFFEEWMPELIIVGPAYGKFSWEEETSRTRDYTPTAIDMFPEGGGADKFLQVLGKELVPFVESHYRVKKSDRALWGHSGGGLFVLYTLFHEPSLFQRYIATSPSLWWDNWLALEYEKEWAGKHDNLNARFFISIGEFEEPGDVAIWHEFAQRLDSRKYPDLDFRALLIGHECHISVTPVALAHGLRFVYSDHASKLRPTSTRPEGFPDYMQHPRWANDVRYRAGDSPSLFFRVNEPFPATDTRTFLMAPLDKLGWKKLHNYLLNPAVPSSHTEGWIEARDYRHAEGRVRRWNAEWINDNNDILQVQLEYREHDLGTVFCQIRKSPCDGWIQEALKEYKKQNPTYKM
jgi:predicted alpha/beta superfamily hydrolase